MGPSISKSFVRYQFRTAKRVTRHSFVSSTHDFSVASSRKACTCRTWIWMWRMRGPNRIWAAKGSVQAGTRAQEIQPRNDESTASPCGISLVLGLSPFPRGGLFLISWRRFHHSNRLSSFLSRVETTTTRLGELIQKHYYSFTITKGYPRKFF